MERKHVKYNLDFIFTRKRLTLWILDELSVILIKNTVVFMLWSVFLFICCTLLILF